jgi:anti-anti-sigma factor
MVKFEKRGNIDIVSFSVNKINALITEEIKEQVIRIFDQQNTKLIVDLKGVEYIDSSGFGCLLSISRESKNSYGMMKLACPEPSVRSLIETLHLQSIFEIHSNLEDCVRSFK